MEDWTDLFKKAARDELGNYTPQNKKFSQGDDLSTEASEEELRKLLSKNFEKLKHKMSYLNIEHEEVSEVFSHAKKTFISTMFEYCSRKNITPPFTEGVEDKKNSKEKDQNQIKELYREIVKQTHPDKTANLTKEEMNFRSNLYQQATSGKLSGDLSRVLQVALDLDIEIENINPSLLKSIELEIEKKELEISKIKEDIMYKWYYLSSEDQQSLFENLTKNQKPTKNQ
jgi:RNase P protein component